MTIYLNQNQEKEYMELHLHFPMLSQSCTSLKTRTTYFYFIRGNPAP